MVLLDTHVVIWLMEDERRLSGRASREIAKADVLFVSPVSCWEVATLSRLKRIALDRDVYRWVADLLEEERITLAPLSPQASVSAGLLPADGFPSDPSDCFLYAQARELAVPFVTKDDRIREYARHAGDVRTIW